MEPAPVSMMLACFAVCAALLWLAADIGVAASSQPAALAPALSAAAVVFGACGLWWPAHAMRVHDTATASGLARELLVWLPVALLAALARAVGALGRGRSMPWAVAAAAAMPVAAYANLMFGAPAFLRLTPGPVWLGPGVLTLSLVAMLILSNLHLGSLPHGVRIRAVAAAGAAGLVSLGAAMSAPAGAPAATAAAPWPLMAGLVAVGLLMRMVLKHAARAASGARARSKRATAVDGLTGLPTRLVLEKQLHVAARKCDARGTRLAVLFIDLDGFKPVNDNFGHSSGDRVLEQVGHRLQEFARAGSVAARVGGDEFLLLVIGAGTEEAMGQLAAKLIEVLSRPYVIDEREVNISCSVGIAMYPGNCRASKLIARADAAMYAAKRAGGSRFDFYSPEMDADRRKNFDMLRELREALANDELELYYQPKIDARSGKVTAAEALLRWKHPTRGLMLPARFIPLAERSGLIVPLGNWVIEAACKQARAWRDKGLRMRVAINLSAHQMRQDDIVDRIAQALTRYRIHPSLLTCEITESAAMEDTAATQLTFRRLGELGAHLSIDDFGTGYSSLSYLRQLPAEELKIDASFVKDLDHSADARAVVDAVVKLAQALGLKVVAEGVETVRQQRTLVQLGCDELQGYLFAKPMTARALLLWAINDRSASATFRDSLFGETREASLQGLDDDTEADHSSRSVI